MPTPDKIALLKLKALNHKPLIYAELNFVIETLKSPTPNRSLTFLEILPKTNILYLLNSFADYPLATQKKIIPLLSIHHSHRIYGFLFNLFFTTKNQKLQDLLMVCLANTTYFILPFIFIYLGSKDPETQKRLKIFMSKINIEKYRIQLKILPKIPFEKKFREVYGDQVIDQILKPTRT
jgi:hypothetical protein